MWTSACNNTSYLDNTGRSLLALIVSSCLAVSLGRPDDKWYFEKQRSSIPLLCTVASPTFFRNPRNICRNNRSLRNLEKFSFTFKIFRIYRRFFIFLFFSTRYKLLPRNNLNRLYIAPSVIITSSIFNKSFSLPCPCPSLSTRHWSIPSISPRSFRSPPAAE